MNRKLKTVICMMAAAVLLLSVVVWAADTEPGSEGDPLISLSYLQETFTEYITGLFRQELDTKAETVKSELESEISALEEQQLAYFEKAEAASFQIVSLKAGETLELKEGAELIFRKGTIRCSAKLTLLDEVNGGSELKQNRLFVVLEAGSVTADAASTLLVRAGA